VTANVSRNGADAIMIEGTPEAMTNRVLIANLIGAARLPAIYTIPEFVDAGPPHHGHTKGGHKGRLFIFNSTRGHN